MATQLTFEQFNPNHDSVYEIGNGVVPEMAQAFDHELTERPSVENLGNLISIMAPEKELQKNIAFIQEKLEATALETSTSWVDRSGLLLPTARWYMNPETSTEPRNFDVAVITGGVRNWMVRRAERLLPELDKVDQVLLVAGNRSMNTTEGPDVEEGMTESDFMGGIIQGLLANAGAEVELVRVDSKIGNEIMEATAEHIKNSDSALISSNAGAWVQNAGQLRRALQNRYESFDEDGSQLFVVSDHFPLGTGIEPTATHQNPYSALGIILRNTQELIRHQN